MSHGVRNISGSGVPQPRSGFGRTHRDRGGEGRVAPGSRSHMPGKRVPLRSPRLPHLSPLEGGQHERRTRVSRRDPLQARQGPRIDRRRTSGDPRRHRPRSAPHRRPASHRLPLHRLPPLVSDGALTPPRRWIRLDVSWEESGWLYTLTGEAAGCWPRLLCMVKRDGVRGRCKAKNPEVLAIQWRVSLMSVTALLAAAMADGALVVDGSDWAVSNWGTYQEPDKTGLERQRRYRERNAVTPVTNGVTRRVTETLTLTEPKKKTHKPASWRICPEDFEPTQKHLDLATELHVNYERELTAFREWEFKDPKTDASKAFFRWLRSAGERSNGNGNGKSKQPQYHDLQGGML